MIKRLGWIVIIAAAAAAGCLTGSGAVRGQTEVRTAADAPGPAAISPDLQVHAGR